MFYAHQNYVCQSIVFLFNLAYHIPYSTIYFSKLLPVFERLCIEVWFSVNNAQRPHFGHLKLGRYVFFSIFTSPVIHGHSNILLLDSSFKYYLFNSFRSFCHKLGQTRYALAVQSKIFFLLQGNVNYINLNHYFIFYEFLDSILVPKVVKSQQVFINNIKFYLQETNYCRSS